MSAVLVCAGINIIPKSQREELILYFTLVSGMPILDPLVLERKAMHRLSIRLSYHLYLVGGNK